MKIIAFTAESEVFKYERLLNENWMRRFPGALWIPLLANKLNNFKITSTDVALNHVHNGFWVAKDIGVIQHLDNPDAEELILLGARPLLLIAMESPVYAKKFFDNINSIASIFPKRIMLQGLIDHLPIEKNKNYTLRFPSFSINYSRNKLPWDERLFLTMVVRNMYANALSSKYLKHPYDIVRWSYRYIKLFKLDSFSHKEKFKFSSLHDKRLDAIIFFGDKNCLDLFGHGWNNIKNLPIFYQKKLKPVLQKIKPTPIDDKISAISKYKFALCYENASYKGGLSEKIIDCFVAGTIPVYLGATNICEFIPEGAFIDIRQFNSLTELNEKLTTMSTKEANLILKTGNDFLSSKEGQMHSYEGFASFVEELILEYTN